MEKCRQESSRWKRLQTAESPTEMFPKLGVVADLLQTLSHLHMGSAQCCPPLSHSCPEQVLDWAGLCETAWLGLAVLVQQSLSVEGRKSPLEFQMTCGCRHGEAV